MLTFTFSGVDGTMSDVETLTSGMVGKQIRLSFDDSWAGLTKTAVFCAGDTTRVVMDPGETVAIPAEVLAKPFLKLFVGVYGTDAEGTVVIPTILVEGPMIRYGADPIQDETAEELPVWQKLQNQIGDMTLLETEDTSDLVSAVNEVSGLIRSYAGLSKDAAQLLVDILTEANYKENQKDQLVELAHMLGVECALDTGNLLQYWDFLKGGETDLVSGIPLRAASNITYDSTGAHTTAANSYLTFPLQPEGESFEGKILEIKFGQMELVDTGSSIRLATGNIGTQPAITGLFYSASDCWTNNVSVTTDFTDLQLFSGKHLYARLADDKKGIQWYVEDQYICTSTTSYTPTHCSIGCSAGAAYPVTVEYIKIYPAS